jgi:hypothetical protein
MPEGVARDSHIRQGFPPKLDNGNILYNTGPDKSGDPLTELLEWMQNYYIGIKSFASTHAPPVVPPSTHAPPVVPPSTPFYPEQVQNTSSNYWKMPITDIRGVSGYFCKSCNIFSLRLIRDIGCDMTEKRKHMGLQDLIDVDAPLDSIPVTSLRNALNFIMPGIKYGFSLDLTQFFVYLTSKHDSIVVLKLIGVPDRWYLCPVEKGLEWSERIVTNVGNKVRLEDSEVTDFLRRAQASYAIFQIQTETSSRRFAIWITT